MKWLACPAAVLIDGTAGITVMFFQALIPSDDNVFLSLVNQALRGHQQGAP